MSRSITSVIAAACLVFAAYGNGGAQAVNSGAPRVGARTGTADWNQVIAAAKKEGAVTMYGNPGTDSQFEDAAAAFERAYGIKVTISYADGAMNAQKIAIEAQTGHVLGDVYFAGLGTINTLAKNGYAIALDPPNQADVLPSFDVLKGATPLFATVYGILVNTTKLGKVPMPKRWTDLLNPALAGNMIMQDPRLDGGGGTFFISTYDRLGKSFAQSLAAQHPVINGAGAGNAAEEALARGEFAVMISGRAHALEAYPHAPLKWIAPLEGTIVVPIAMTMIKGAPHPNAARLWANYLLRPDVQSSLSTIALPVTRNAPIKNSLLRGKLQFLEVLSPNLDRTKYYADARQFYGQ